MSKIKEEVNELIENLLLFTKNDLYKNQLNKANKLFNKGLEDKIIDLGFNEWFVYDYKFDNSSCIIDEYIKSKNLSDHKKDILEAMKNSFVSVFNVGEVNNQLFLKDIFTKTDYPLKNKSLNHKNVVARVMKLNNENYVIDVLDKWDKDIDSIKKAILKKYNEYAGINKNVSISEFIKNNSLIIYKYLILYRESKDKLVFKDQEFYVHQGIYAIVDKKGFKTKLENDEKIKFLSDEYEGDIYELILEEIVLSEILVKDKTIEIECKNKEDLKKANLYFEQNYKNSLKKIKDEVLNIEQLLD
ncbi:MAG: hypothetical protein ACQEQE_04405 [Bacillota bacterium]